MLLLQFVMYVATEKEEGLYNLYFHSCPNYDNSEPVYIDFTVCIMGESAGHGVVGNGFLQLFFCLPHVVL